MGWDISWKVELDWLNIDFGKLSTGKLSWVTLLGIKMHEICITCADVK